MSDPVLSIDEAAQRKLAEMRDAGRFQSSALRVTVDEEGASFLYQIQIVDQGERTDDDVVVPCDGIPLYVDGASASRLRGAQLQYVDSLSGGGFRFENPNQPRLLQNPLAARVQRVLDDEINPGVAAHGGRVALVDVQEDRAFIRFGGGCQGCGMADVTLRDGVVGAIKRGVPEIREVLDATDHTAIRCPSACRIGA
jgi:Fe/S biogenesis protein NfuA